MHVAELTPLNDARVRAEQVSRPAGRTPAGRRAELGLTALSADSERSCSV
jgi:hypothetical protein